MKLRLIDLSVAILGRAPSEEELFTWYNMPEGYGAVALSLVALPEAQARFNFDQGDTALLNSAYATLFGREPDAEGLEYWLAQLSSGAISQELLVPSLLAGARAQTGDSVDAAIVEQRLDVATNYFSAVESGSQPFDLQEAGQLVAEVTRESVVEQPPELDAGSGIAVQLDKGTVVHELNKTSTLQDGVASVVLTEADIDAFEAALGQLESTASQNFGSIITFSTGSEELELVTVDFVGDSPLRDYAEQVGYFDFIDFALFNGELVLPETIGVGPDTFFYNETELYEYFGYDWQWDQQGPEVLSRDDGAPFTVSVELLDTLGINNLNEVFDAALA